MIIKFGECEDMDAVSNLVNDKRFQAKVLKMETQLLAVFDKNPPSD